MAGGPQTFEKLGPWERANPTARNTRPSLTCLCLSSPTSHSPSPSMLGFNIFLGLAMLFHHFQFFHKIVILPAMSVISCLLGKPPLRFNSSTKSSDEFPRTPNPYHTLVDILVPRTYELLLFIYLSTSTIRL